MAAEDHLRAEIASLEKRLAELDAEREGLLASLEQLQLRYKAESKLPSPSQIFNPSSATTSFSSAEKVALFRSLFRGRDDVFPQRWENSKSGKVGYSPACHNEWARGICEKPRVKCSDCLNQAFVPVTDDIARSHLQGRDLANPKRTGGFVAGVYFRGQSEHCLFGTRGSLPYNIRSDGKRGQGKTAFVAPRSIHSRKPPEMREMIEIVSYAPRLELFAREEFAGWDKWGNQVRPDIILGGALQLPMVGWRPNRLRRAFSL